MATWTAIVASVGRGFRLGGGKANLIGKISESCVAVGRKNVCADGGTITLGTSLSRLFLACSSDLRTRWPETDGERFALGKRLP